MTTESPFFSAAPDVEAEEYPFKARIAANLYGVKSDAYCPQCGEPNVVVTLGASPDPEELPCDEFKFFTFFDIAALPPGVLNGLQNINPNYGLCLERFSSEFRYMNACKVCGYVFSDEDLRAEPGDAFLPLMREDYGSILLVDLAEYFDYHLELDEDEHRSFIDKSFDLGVWNPAPDLWQVIMERNDFDGALTQTALSDFAWLYSDDHSITNEFLEN